MAETQQERISPHALVNFLHSLPASYAFSRLPNANDAYLLAACTQLLGKPSEANRAFAAAVDSQVDRQARDRLADFVYRVAMLAVRQESPEYLRCGFVALALSIASDVGVLHENMAVLNRSAEHLGLEAHSLFEMAGDRTGDPYLTQIITAFNAGTTDYKSLRTFQLKESVGPSGLLYLSIQSDDIPEGWL